MKKIIFIILFCLLLCKLFPLRGETEKSVNWGNVVLSSNDDNWLKDAKTNLEYCNYFSDEALIHEKNIYFASLRGNQIVVWYGKSMNHPADICLYNLDGSFICGYYLKFSLGNGVFNIMVDDNKLFIYMSNSNCAYCFGEDETEYYYISPKYTSYIFEYKQPNLLEGNWYVKYSKEAVYLYNGESCVTQIYNHNQNMGEIEEKFSYSINIIFIIFAAIVLLLCYCIIKCT